jgi:hypothetical protein
MPPICILSTQFDKGDYCALRTKAKTQKNCHPQAEEETTEEPPQEAESITERSLFHNEMPGIMDAPVHDSFFVAI